jgi:hypothetical protein
MKHLFAYTKIPRRRRKSARRRRRRRKRRRTRKARLAADLLILHLQEQLG